MLATGLSSWALSRAPPFYAQKLIFRVECVMSPASAIMTAVYHYGLPGQRETNIATLTTTFEKSCAPMCFDAGALQLTRFHELSNLCRNGLRIIQMKMVGSLNCHRRQVFYRIHPLPCRFSVADQSVLGKNKQRSGFNTG